MSLFNLNKTKPETEFYSILNRELDFCGFSEETKHGFLFFLGVSLPVVMPISIIGKVTKQDNADKILNLYTSDIIKDVNFETSDAVGVFNLFKTFELILVSQQPKDNALSNTDPTDSLQSIQDLLSMQEIIKFHEKYAQLSFKLEPVTNLWDDFFYLLGSYLVAKKFTYQDSYRAGYKLWFVILSSQELLKRVLNKMMPAITPLYQALLYYPIAYVNHPKEFKSNHLFSSVFFFFTAGINPDILKPIHTWHQIVFYKDGTTKLNDAVTFEIDAKQTIYVFGKASQMREGLLGLGDRYLKNNDLAMPELKGQTRSLNDLLNDLQNILVSKYNIYAFPTAWNHRGEYIQFLAILFYETCLHAMVLKEITQSDSSS